MLLRRVPLGHIGNPDGERAAGEANTPMLAFAGAAKAQGLWPFVNMNRTHVVPPCNITEAEAKEGLAALDAALTAADEFTV